MGPSVVDEPTYSTIGGADQKEDGACPPSVARIVAIGRNAMKTQAILRGPASAFLGAARYGLTLAFFCAVWWYDARYLYQAFDANLAIVKRKSGLIDGSGKTDAMLRAFAAKKVLLLGEGSRVIWAVGCAVAFVMRRFIGRGPDGKTSAWTQARGAA